MERKEEETQGTDQPPQTPFLHGYGSVQSVSTLQDHPTQPQAHDVGAAGAVEETVVVPQILFIQGYGSAQSVAFVQETTQSSPKYTASMQDLRLLRKLWLQ